MVAVIDIGYADVYPVEQPERTRFQRCYYRGLTGLKRTWPVITPSRGKCKTRIVTTQPAALVSSLKPTRAPDLESVEM